MRRLVAATAAFAAVTAWASAQPTLTADRAKQFRRNHVLVERLVGHTVTLANATGGVPRADACRASAGELAAALTTAARDDDADRVAELGDYLSTLLTQGLLPTLVEVKADTPPGSPQAAELKVVHERATADLSAAVGGLPASGKLGQSRRVADVKKRLQAAADALAKW